MRREGSGPSTVVRCPPCGLCALTELRGPVLGSSPLAFWFPVPFRVSPAASPDPAALAVCAGVVLTIPIAERAALGVPSNHGMQLTSGRRGYPAGRVCSLQFAVERSMLPALPLAADP